MSDTLKMKLVITGMITVKTGLAIGGNKGGIDIGGLDNPVVKVKTSTGDVPFIPGSSLKGKMRSLIARVAGSVDVKSDVKLMNTQSEYKHLAKVFGYGADDVKRNKEANTKVDEEVSSGEALLKVRDAFIIPESYLGTEEKMENSIHRVSGKANPRPLERVIPEAIFGMELCLDVYNITDANEHLQLIQLALDLLEQDYLGGGGSRGNGRITINNREVTPYCINNRELQKQETIEFNQDYSITLESNER